jgi:acyl-CoA reductase-like NAD-dependent aldehyde dehydrogenase
MTILGNFTNNAYTQPKANSKTLDVSTPHTGETIATVHLSTVEEVGEIIANAERAFGGWSKLTSKTRVQYLRKFLYLVENKYMDELADLIVKGSEIKRY